MFSAKWHISYCVYNSPQLDPILNKLTPLLLCLQQSITRPCSEKNDTHIIVFTSVHYLTMSSAKWHFPYCVHISLQIDHVLSQMTYLLLCPQQSNNLTTSSARWQTYYSVQNSPDIDHVLSQMTLPLLCSQQSSTWPCSEANNTLVTMFTIVNCLTISSRKWHNYFCVHDSLLLDHVLRQMTHLLLCSQQSTTWPCSETNFTHVTVFTTIHCLNIFWAK